MARLQLIQGPGAGKNFPLSVRRIVLGRQPGVDLMLEAVEVSRQHARLTPEQGRYFLEDLGSSNGTFVNNTRIKERTELHDRDQVRVGPFVFQFEAGEPAQDMTIRAEVPPLAPSRILLKQDAASKLGAVLEITQQLSRTLDLDELLPRLLDHLLALFPQAERGLILIREGGQMRIRASRVRQPRRGAPADYSRSLVQRVLEEGVGLLADETQSEAFAPTHTLTALGIRSCLCVPVTDHDNRPLGVLQLDRFGPGTPFTPDDLRLLATIALQTSVVLENAALHAKLLEQERIKRDLELARLSRLVAGIAHEVNNPLAFVSNNLAIFRRDTETLRQALLLYREADAVLAEQLPELHVRIRQEEDLPEALDGLPDLLERTKDGLKRIQQVVNNLRDFARLDRSEVDEVDLNTGIEATVNVIRGRADKQLVGLEMDLAPLPLVQCHPAKINQVIFNLLANAIDASAEGGKVTVRSRPTPGGVELSVLDTGEGIDPAVRDKVFDPFFTTRPLGKGVGLGLSISYGIVQSHGGTIDFESVPGQGTCFRVCLPCKPAGIPKG